MIGQSGNPVRQDFTSGGGFRQSRSQGTYGRENLENKPAPSPGFSQVPQQPPCRPPLSTLQYSQQCRPLPSPETPPWKTSAHAVHLPNKSWKFTNSFEQEKPNVVEKRGSNRSQTARPVKTQVEMSSTCTTCKNTQTF